MKRIDNYDAVEAKDFSEFAKPTAGGYCCVIVGAEDVPYDERTKKGNYLKIAVDIAEGELAGYYCDLQAKFGKWSNAATMYKSYNEKAIPFFKQFTNAVEQSNHGYRWNFDEKTLSGKWIGVVFGEEEYTGQDGSVKTRLHIASVCNVDKIRSGDFKVPEKKTLPGSHTNDILNSLQDSNEDIPFFV